MKKIFYIIILFSAAIPSLIAQSGSSYTRIGLGDIEYTYSARKIGMGLIGVSLSDYDYLSTTNPASWNMLRRTRIETGVNYYGIKISENNQSSYSGEGSFSGFTFAFPVSSLYGVSTAFGLVPYSNVSYKVAELVAPGGEADEYDVLYEGSGGLSKIFLGSSYRLPFNMSIGAMFEYYFGNLNYYSSADFTAANSYSAEYRRTYSARGVGATIGLITPDFAEMFGSETFSNFHAGVAVNYIGSLTTDTILVGKSSLQTDTISSGNTQMEIPVRITAGISFVIDKTYLVSLDYVMQPMSEYKFRDTKYSTLQDIMKVSAGFEYRALREPGSTFWDLVIWRAGLSYEQTQYKINGIGVNQYSVHGGFSIPLSSENTIDVGLQYALRGSNDPGLFKEDIIRMNVGISLGEFWFIRQEK